MKNNVADFLKINNFLKNRNITVDIEADGDTLEFILNKEVDDVINELEHIGIEVTKSAAKSFELVIGSDLILFFKDKEDFLDQVINKNKIIEDKSVIIWSFDNTCLVAENFTSDLTKEIKFIGQHFIRNVLQYREFMNIILDEKYGIIEFERPKSPDNELYISSKGSENHLISLSYKKIEKESYEQVFERIPIDKFLARITNRDNKAEWLACFKSVVCSFFDKQSDSKRTLLWLYENFHYLYTNTEKNYLLFVNKFNFDKISRSFRKDKELYFNNLNELQSKLSAQLISIPLTIGAAMLTGNFVTNNGLPKGSISFAISCYIIFVMASVLMVLIDVIKQKKDIQDEKVNLKKYYDNLYDDFKKDFSFLLIKSNMISCFAIFMLILFLLILLVVWFTKDFEFLYYILFI